MRCGERRDRAAATIDARPVAAVPEIGSLDGRVNGPLRSQAAPGPEPGPDYRKPSDARGPAAVACSRTFRAPWRDADWYPCCGAFGDRGVCLIVGAAFLSVRPWRPDLTGRTGVRWSWWTGEPP
jgi:hypothetical protein